MDEQGRSSGVMARARFTTLRSAVGLVARAARREMVQITLLTFAVSLIAGGELLVGRSLLQHLTDDSSPALADLTPQLIALAVLLTLTALTGAWVSELRLLISDLVQRQVIGEVLEVAARASLEDFEQPGFHDQLQRARERAESHAWSVVWGLVTLLATVLTALAIIGVLFSVAPILVPIAMLAYVPMAVVSVRNTRAYYRMHYELTEVDRDRAYHERLLTGRAEAAEVRSFGIAEHLRSGHRALFDRRIVRLRQLVRARTAHSLIGAVLTSAVLVVTLAVVLWLALDDRISMADAAVAVVGLQQLSGRLRGVGDAVTSVHEGVTFLRDFETFRDQHPVSATEAIEPSAVAPAATLLVVEDLHFCYPGSTTEALAGVSFALGSGLVVAVVGPNGSGKTTLAKLLCGLLTPTGGRITIDGIDMEALPKHVVRSMVAPVFQDVTHFEFTARENIIFGDIERPVDDERVAEAARRAGVDEMIAALPDGYDTRLSTAFTGGSELSIGQWQRLAIARAFYRDAPIVVLDEPTASLDPRAERDLMDRLHELGRDRMVVFVSHRFATVRRADRVLVMLEGRVHETGSHDELMELDGVYAELYRLQAGQFGNDGSG
jgi:ATP-binding cassette subfamily B protein